MLRYCPVRVIKIPLSGGIYNPFLVHYLTVFDEPPF